MQELYNILCLFLSPETLLIIGGIFYSLAHIVPLLPVSITGKIPDLVMVVINAVAAQHSANLAARTDIKGNIIEATIYDPGAVG